MAFTFGAAFAGTAGALFSHYFFLGNPASFTFMRSFDILTMVVLGGSGSMTGAITGATLLTFSFRLFVGLPGMAYDYLFCYYDYPDAVLSARLAWQQGIELENV